MSTVDNAVEAGARALSEHWRDMHTNGSLDRERGLAGHAARAMWPILSASLREVHKPDFFYEGDDNAECKGCMGPTRWVDCPTMRAIHKIDKGLGL